MWEWKHSDTHTNTHWLSPVSYQQTHKSELAVKQTAAVFYTFMKLRAKQGWRTKRTKTFFKVKHFEWLLWRQKRSNRQRASASKLRSSVLWSILSFITITRRRSWVCCVRTFRSLRPPDPLCQRLRPELVSWRNVGEATGGFVSFVLCCFTFFSSSLTAPDPTAARSHPDPLLF